MTQFKKGDSVEWRSQAGGFYKEKKGIVVAVVPKDASTLPYNDKAVSETGARGLDYPGLSRNHESYIVFVPTKTGRGKGRLYWPAANKLIQKESD